MDRPSYPDGYGIRKRRSQSLAFAICRALSLMIVLVLFAILGFIIVKGAGVISWDFLTKAPADGMTSACDSRNSASDAGERPGSLPDRNHERHLYE